MPIANKSDDILIIAEKPTLVDCIACNFAFKTADMVRGIKDMTII